MQSISVPICIRDVSDLTDVHIFQGDTARIVRADGERRAADRDIRIEQRIIH